MADAVSYEYDELGRLKTVTHDDGVVVEYDYDPAGNRKNTVITASGDNPINDSIPTLGVGPNLIDITTWPTGSAPPGVADIVPWQTAATYYNETRWARVMGPGFSGYVTAMEAGQTEPDSNGGGTNKTNNFTIDPTRGYEYSIYVRKHDLILQHVYLGPANSIPATVKLALNNSEYTNPYFWAWNPATQQSNLDNSKWYKVVGYVLPEGYPLVSGYGDWGGVYEVETGTKVANVSPFRWSEHRSSNSTFLRFFTYYHEAAQGVFTTYFYQPAVYLTDISYTPVVPSVTLVHTNANEGDTITFTVSLSSATTVDTAVNYVVDHPGGANSASANDYTASSGTLSIAAGNTQATVTVPTTEDSTAEVNELIRITLSAPVRLTLSDTTRQAYIYDDDSSASFSINDVSVSEGGTLLFTVTKAGSTALTHNVNYATTNGTAGSGDYTSASGTLSFAPSQTSSTVSVSTVEDSTHESDETLYLNLSSATNGATIADGQGIGTINDDDPANSPPNAVNDYVYFSWINQTKWVYVLSNDSDPDGDPLTITSVTQPTNAVVTIHPSPSRLKIVSTGFGSRTFTYSADDGNGGTDTATVTVDVDSGM